MSKADDASLDLLFRKARTYTVWQDKPVEDSLLQQVYDLCKWGPTSSNCLPMRIVFVKSNEAKERLKPFLAGGNVDKTMHAPATAIIAYDSEFYTLMPKLWPHSDMKSYFEKNPDAAKTTAFRNGSLQGAYFMLAARSLGLDCGPMSGFENDKIDAEFFKGTTWKSNFLCNVGYGDASKLFPRGPRLEWNEVCKIL
jgi:3-hydroxypropanoate dehydrogenase